MDTTRRQALLSGLFGAGALGLRALATGLPTWLLADPLRARATPQLCQGADPLAAQYLILVTSEDGDPLNANVPGTYDSPDIYHSSDFRMAPLPMMVGGLRTVAARPWASLDAAVLARTCFFHHGTYTINHGNHPKVLRLMGAVRRQEMLISLLAKNLAPCLGTIQAEPAVISPNLITYQGRVLPILSPPDLSALLSGPNTPLQRLQRLRDADMDRLNALFKKDGTAAQRALLDEHAQSQTQARSLSALLLDSLSQVKGSSRSDLNITAAVLIKMNVAPVVTMSYSWGGDNHSDSGLATETTETVASVEAITNLMTRLRQFGLQDRVTFVAQNVFGRTLSRKVRDPNGRDHHGNHHCSVIIGSRIRSSLVGGVELKGIEYEGQDISSQTGQGGAGGDIAFADTLGAVGKTLGVAVGVSQSVLDVEITQGKVVKAALNLG